jgi:hypothetical protein
MNAAAATAHEGIAEAIERLEAMPAFLESALDAATREDLLARPAEGEFSLTEHACHLRDVEREGYLVRVRRILGETLPRLEGFDGTVEARARDYQAQDARIAAQEFAAARREVTGLLAATTADDLGREAIFAGQRIDLRALVAMMEAHDREHREQIGALLERLDDL